MHAEVEHSSTRRTVTSGPAADMAGDHDCDRQMQGRGIQWSVTTRAGASASVVSRDTPTPTVTVYYDAIT